MMLNNILVVAYDGTPFYGWQKQPNLPTVQGELERVLSILFNTKVKVVGAGRTDRGVHARRQFANFYSPADFDASSLKKALNSLLPPEIRVLKVVKDIDPSINVRKVALWREYKYFLYRGEVLPPFFYRYCYHLRRDIDINLLKYLPNFVIGTHDFSAFCDGEEKTKNKIRTIYECRFEERRNFLIFTIRGDSFLRHMVRIILSTLIDIASGRKEKDLLLKALSSGDRSLCSAGLPPNGLWLWNVGFSLKGQDDACFRKGV